MMTKYGELNNKQIEICLDRYTKRLFQIIPMNEKEDERQTLPLYVNSLIREFFGNSSILFEEHFLSIVGTLEGLQFDNHDLLRTDVFKAMGIIKKIKERIV